MKTRFLPLLLFACLAPLVCHADATTGVVVFRRVPLESQLATNAVHLPPGSPAVPVDAPNHLWLGTLTGNVLLNMQGAPGTMGTPGTVWYNSAGSPAAGIGINGDYDLDAATGNVYTKVAGAWSVTTNIKGTNGTNGTNGAPGQAGSPGPNYPIKSGSTTLTTAPTSLTFGPGLLASVTGNDVLVNTPAPATQAANTVYAGPVSGSAAAAGFRGLVSADLPQSPTLQNLSLSSLSFVGNSAGGAPTITTSYINGQATSLTLSNIFQLKLLPSFSLLLPPNIQGNNGSGDMSITGDRGLNLGTGSGTFNLRTSGTTFLSCANYPSPTDIVFTLLDLSRAFVIQQQSGQTRNPFEVQTSTKSIVANITPAGIVNAQGYSVAGVGGYTGTIPTTAQSEKVVGGIITGYTDSSGTYHGN